MYIRKGDQVEVITGKEVGKRGKVLHISTDKGRATVEHLHMIKCHKRPTQQKQATGIIEREGTVNASNLMLVCGKCNRAVRVGHKFLDDGKKIRICRRCGEEI